MAWLDDRVWCHPKVARLSDSAFRVWVSGIAYSSGFSTGGKLDQQHQRLLGARTKQRQELLATGLWEDSGDDDGSVLIHDWSEHNEKRDKRKADDRERKRRVRAIERGLSGGQDADTSADTTEDRRTLKSEGVKGESKSLLKPSSTSSLDPDRNGHHEDLLPEFHSHALDLLIVRTGANLDPRAEKRLLRAAEGASERDVDTVLKSVGRNRAKVDNLVGFAVRGLEAEKAKR